MAVDHNILEQQHIADNSKYSFEQTEHLENSY